MLEITKENRDLRYFLDEDILIMTMGKAGTSSFLHWFYTGLTSLYRYSRDECEGRPLQNVSNPCWRNKVVYLFELPEDEQWRALRSQHTLRIAIQRDPYERLVSCFKSKLSCQPIRFGTALPGRGIIVPRLRREAGIDPATVRRPECMNITEFAQALLLARDNLRARDPTLRSMDRHYRPQLFFFDEIEYDLVFDVSDLRNSSLLSPIVSRLRYKDAVKDGIVKRTGTTGSPRISEQTERMLREFAKESRPGRLKRMLATSKD